MPEDLRGDLVGCADEQGAVRRELSVELRAGDRPPTALLADGAERAGVAREEIIGGLLRRFRNLPQAMHADLQAIG